MLRGYTVAGRVQDIVTAEVDPTAPIVVRVEGLPDAADADSDDADDALDTDCQLQLTLPFRLRAGGLAPLWASATVAKAGLTGRRAGARRAAAAAAAASDSDASSSDSESESDADTDADAVEPIVARPARRTGTARRLLAAAATTGSSRRKGQAPKRNRAASSSRARGGAVTGAMARRRQSLRLDLSA